MGVLVTSTKAVANGYFGLMLLPLLILTACNPAPPPEIDTVKKLPSSWHSGTSNSGLVFFGKTRHKNKAYLFRIQENRRKITRTPTGSLPPLRPNNFPDRLVDPNGQRLAYVDGKHNVIVRNLRTGEEKTLLTAAKEWEIEALDWASDSKRLRPIIPVKRFNKKAV